MEPTTLVLTVDHASVIRWFGPVVQRKRKSGRGSFLRYLKQNLVLNGGGFEKRAVDSVGEFTSLRNVRVESQVPYKEAVP